MLEDRSDSLPEGGRELTEEYKLAPEINRLLGESRQVNCTLEREKKMNPLYLAINEQICEKAQS